MSSYDWSELKERKRKLSAQVRAAAPTSRLSPASPVLANHLEKNTAEFIKHQVTAEPYWFQRIELLPGLYSPGWSDPSTEKLPYFGLPQDLTGMRVLDIGCAEGYFSFEAERRGAREVIAIDVFPDSIRRFNIVRAARQSNVNAFLLNVYDLEPKLNNEMWDPTVFWLFNSTCCLAMLDHVGFTDLQIVSNDPQPFVVSANVPDRSNGVPPDQTEAPWC